MATITKPMALDESFNTTESTPRNQADVLAAIEGAIRQGFGQSAADVSYDNTTSGLTADDVQEAIDELAAEKVDNVAGKGLSSNDFTDEDKEALDNMELDIAGTQTVSGNPITLTDAAPINAESLVVEFSPKQDLHGQSAPYVGGAGRQKLDVMNQGGGSDTSSGVTFSADNTGKVTANGTAGTDYPQCFFNLQVGLGVLKPGNSYRLVSNGNIWFSIYDYYDGDWHLIGVTEDYTFVVNANATNFLVRATTPQNGWQYDNAEAYPVIVDANEQDTSFAPYSNICPITGYTECEVDDVGKNLLNPSTVTLQRYLQSDGGVGIDGGSDWSYTDYIKIEAGETYSLSGVSNMGTVAKHCFYDENKNFISSINTTEYIFTAPANAKFVRLSNRTLNYSSVMLEKNNQATTYEPYYSSNATIQFGQTVYGGRSNFTDGGTSDEIGVVDLGSLNWSYDATQSHPFFYTSDLSSVIKHIIGLPQPLVACEQYRILDIPTNVTDSVWADASVNASMVYHTSSPNYVYVRDDRFTDPTVFKTANNGNHLAYMKATPTTISTPPSPLKLLKGANNLSTNGTTITLGYQPDNVIGDVKGEIEKCAVDAEFMQFTDGTDTFTDVNLSLDASLHTVSVVGSKIEQKRFICFEVMDKMGGVLQGILASCIAFTDGAKTPSGTAFRAYIESLQMYVNFRIYGSGGSYTLAYQSESSFSASAFFVRVRMMNNL